MFANRRFEILRFGKVDVLSPGIPQDVAEEVHSATAFAGKLDVVHGVIHLSLIARRSLETHDGRLLGARTKFPDVVAQDRIAAFVATLTKLFQQTHDGDVRIASQQRMDLLLVLVQLAGSTLCGGTQFRRRSSFSAILLMPLDDPPYTFARHSQVTRDAALRLAIKPARDHVQFRVVVHVLPCQ